MPASLLPSTPEPGALRRGELLAYRRFAILCAIAIPLLGVLHHRAAPDAFDPPAQRAVVTVLCLAIIALTYARSQRYLVETIYFTFSSCWCSTASTRTTPSGRW